MNNFLEKIYEFLAGSVLSVYVGLICDRVQLQQARSATAFRREAAGTATATASSAPPPASSEVEFIVEQEFYSSLFFFSASV
jgi:hypothetical protein